METHSIDFIPISLRNFLKTGIFFTTLTLLVLTVVTLAIRLPKINIDMYALTWPLNCAYLDFNPKKDDETTCEKSNRNVMKDFAPFVQFPTPHSADDTKMFDKKVEILKQLPQEVCRNQSSVESF